MNTRLHHLLAAALLASATLGASAEKKLYDFVVPRDGSFRQALEAANSRQDTTSRYRIFICQGDYIIPTEGTTVGGDGQTYGDARSYLTAPNVSIVGEGRELTTLTNVTPPATWDNGFGPSCPIEGIGRGDVLIINPGAHDTYLSGVTLKSGMEDQTGRNIVLHDRSDKTIADDICIWGYQDTYVSNNDQGRFYFGDGVIRGRTDYICGKGDVYYDGVTFQQVGDKGYLAVPSVPRRYGYVMKNCYIKSETPGVTYYLGRPWGKGTPTAIFIDTKVDTAPIASDDKGQNGWANMSGGYPARFAEYNTYLAGGEPVSLEGRRASFTDREGNEHPNNPVLTADEAASYTMANVLDGWNPTVDTAPAPLPEDVRVQGGQLTWKGSDEALLYAVCRHGKVVDFTTETSYKLRRNADPECWSVRAANKMGKLGEAVSAMTPERAFMGRGMGKWAIRRTAPEFFKTDEARRIGDQILLWQRVTGGWPKNVDMASPMTEEQKAEVLADKERLDDSTTDNDATNTQIRFLARLYNGTGDTKYREAVLRGVDYLLSGQYANGGWPQFWPDPQGYQTHITYNDNAMVNTMTILRDIADGAEPFDSDLVDKTRIKKAGQAFKKGVDCILASQMVIDGTPTVWCQQHDRVTMEAAPARAYELPSYCSMESAGILRLLMQIPNPDKRVIKAVHNGMAWLDKYKLTGLSYRSVDINGKRERLLFEDPASKTVLWARFYDLDNATPYVCDRDGIPVRRLEEIGTERRNGYGWYNDNAASLYPVYNEWADRYDPAGKVNISLDTKGANENGTIEMFTAPMLDESLFDAVVNRGESIQAAIEKAPENGTEPFKILIKNGLYNEKVIIDRPNIVLVGQNRDSCVIVGAEARGQLMKREHNGERVHAGVVYITDKGDDCLLSGLTVINNYGTTVTPTTNHQFAVYGRGTRTIIINSNIISDGNDALSLWGAGDDGKGGLYYHADLFVRCPGVDFICPRGTCYATRCRFLGDTRAILWHDGRGDKNNKFVITDSEFDAYKPTPLGRYHHDSQFMIVNCRMSKNIIDEDIDHAYAKRKPGEQGKPADPCPWGKRVYYHGCVREGGHSGWLADNLSSAPGSPAYYTTTAKWTFDGKWDPESRIRDLWKVLAYK